MAIPKKGLKKIMVDNQQYVWLKKSDKDDGHFYVTVSLSERKGQILSASINILTQNQGFLIITGYVVRQIILLGLANGWTPEEQKQPFIFNRRVKEDIDLSLGTFSGQVTKI